TPEERARAAALAGLVDDLLAGAPAPPALAAEERALVETAAMIHAAARPVTLGMERAERIVAAAATEIVTETEAVAPTPIRGPSRRLRRVAPWAVAALAAAAAVLLALRAAERTPVAPAPLPAELRSRPADRLVGESPQPFAGPRPRPPPRLFP